MDYVNLGRSNLKVSRLCLGAMGFGSKSWRDWVLDEAASAPIVARAVEHGINFFDTCDFYSAGESERILGNTLLKTQPRDSIVVATKAGNPMAPHCNGRGFSRKHLRCTALSTWSPRTSPGPSWSRTGRPHGPTP